MSGVDNLRPSQPKYCVIWDAEIVLEIWGTAKGHRINIWLSKLFAMLLSLKGMTRCSELYLLDNGFMALGESKVILKLSGKPKKFKKECGSPEPIEFVSSGESLCPVENIKVATVR